MLESDHQRWFWFYAYEAGMRYGWVRNAWSIADKRRPKPRIRTPRAEYPWRNVPQLPKPPQDERTARELAPVGPGVCVLHRTRMVPKVWYEFVYDRGQWIQLDLTICLECHAGRNLRALPPRPGPRPGLTRGHPPHKPEGRRMKVRNVEQWQNWRQRLIEQLNRSEKP